MQGQIKMKFVFGNAALNTPKAWWLVIDQSSKDFVIDHIIVQTGKRIAGRLLHDCKTGRITNTNCSSVLVDAIEARALQDVTLNLIDRFGWYMNRCGGMCPSLKLIEKSTNADEWPLLQMTTERLLKTAKFSKWPNGDHWYVKLSDGRDVEVDGRLKWKSKKEAEEATKKFLNLDG